MDVGTTSHKQLVSYKDYDNECNVENFKDVDDEGMRPHVSLGTCNTRDTPIKKGALAHKNSIGSADLL
jgi:hypothetical protein